MGCAFRNWLHHRRLVRTEFGCASAFVSFPTGIATKKHPFFAYLNIRESLIGNHASITEDMVDVEEHELEEFPASRRRAHSHNSDATLVDTAPDNPEPTLVGSHRSARGRQIPEGSHKWAKYLCWSTVILLAGLVVAICLGAAFRPHAFGLKDETTHARILLHRSKLAVHHRSPFGRWGVETLYKLHRRALIQIQWKWCMENVCSGGHTLSVMCKKKAKDLNRFEKQECKWCWNDHSNMETTPLQRMSIIKHCNVLSHRAANFLLAVCGLLLFLLFLISTILLYKLWSKRKAKQDASLPISASLTNKQARNFWPFGAVSRVPKSFQNAEVSNRLRPNVTRRHRTLSKQSKNPRTGVEDQQHGDTQMQMEEADPSLPDGVQHVPDKWNIPAVGAIVESLNPLKTNNSIQRISSQTNLGAQSGQRRSPRRSATSSGSEHISMTQSMATTRRPSIREPGPGK